MTRLAAIERLKDAIKIDDTSDDDNLFRAIDAASEWIEWYCGRTFAVDTVDTTHYFYPESDGSVSVPDLVTVTSIKTDTAGDRTYATTLTTDDYELLPLDGPPYTTIRSWPTTAYGFMSGQLVEVVGIFGNAIPRPVEQACILLATRYYKRSEAPFGILQSTDLGQFTRISKEDPDVISLLEPFRVTSGSSWVLV